MGNKKKMQRPDQAWNDLADPRLTTPAMAGKDLAADPWLALRMASAVIMGMTDEPLPPGKTLDTGMNWCTPSASKRLRTDRLDMSTTGMYRFLLAARSWSMVVVVGDPVAESLEAKSMRPAAGATGGDALAKATVGDERLGSATLGATLLRTLLLPEFGEFL